MTHSLILMQQSNLTFPYYIAYKQQLLTSSLKQLYDFTVFLIS